MRAGAIVRGWCTVNGHVVLAVAGSVLFVVLRPPVADLQAADARAAAAVHGVGLGYWLSWFGGTAPGGYSILSAAITATIGVTLTATAAAIAIGLLAGPVLVGSARPRSAAYLVVAAAQCDLWSGRVAFGLGSAFAVAALLALRRGRPLIGGIVNVLTALISPVASVFLLLALGGPAIAHKHRRGQYVVFAALSLVGLAVPALVFGAPGAMPFGLSTFAWTIAIPISLLLIVRRVPPHLRITIYLTIAAVVALYIVPNGLGANIQRFTFLLLPPLVWAVSRAGRTLTILVLLPALSYAGYNTVSDLVASSAPSAQASYYQPLDSALRAQPLLANHRAEVIDTPTHGAAAALASTIYLARGWEPQTDTADNPIFYTRGALTAASYRQWLDNNAVAYVAVPDRYGTPYAREVILIDHTPPYLRLVWHNQHWRLYVVDEPEPIVTLPAHLIRATESSLTISVPAPAQLTLRIRPSRFLQLTGPDQRTQPICSTPLTATSTQIRVPAPGIYRLTSSVSAAAVLDPDKCR